MQKVFAAVIVAAGLWSRAAMAADPALAEPAVLDQAFFGFAGRYTQEILGESLTLSMPTSTTSRRSASAISGS